METKYYNISYTFSGNIMGTNGSNGHNVNGRLSSTANEVDEDDFDPDDLG